MMLDKDFTLLLLLNFSCREQGMHLFVFVHVLAMLKYLKVFFSNYIHSYVGVAAI